MLIKDEMAPKRNNKITKGLDFDIEWKAQFVKTYGFQSYFHNKIPNFTEFSKKNRLTFQFSEILQKHFSIFIL